MVLFVWYVVVTSEFVDVNIQIKPFQQYFHVVLFVLYVVLTFELVNECYGINTQ